MNFLSMEYFIAVMAKRNITKAAEELHITQQTLSAHIAAIEKELACQLIIRSNPLELTYAGEVFLRYASIFYENYQSMWNEFNDLTSNQRGKLLVGVDHTRSCALLPDLVAAFQARYPNIEVRMVEGNNVSLQRGLVNKDIDLAIACLPESIHGMEICDFYEEEVVMLVPEALLAQHHLEAEPYLDDLSAFSNFPFVLGSKDELAGQISREIIEKSGFQPIIKAQTDNAGTRILLCTKGIGICFCPISFVPTLLNAEQMKHLRLFHFRSGATYPMRFAYRRQSYQWKMILEFIRISLEESRQRHMSDCELLL